VLRLLDSLRALTDELHEAEVTRWDERVASEGEWDDPAWEEDDAGTNDLGG
jgi:hypothetical protein